MNHSILTDLIHGLIPLIYVAIGILIPMTYIFFKEYKERMTKYIIRRYAKKNVSYKHLLRMAEPNYYDFLKDICKGNYQYMLFGPSVRSNDQARDSYNLLYDTIKDNIDSKNVRCFSFVDIELYFLKNLHDVHFCCLVLSDQNFRYLSLNPIFRFLCKFRVVR